MWTICWIETNYAEEPVDKWDRLERKSDVVAKLKELEASETVDMNDVLVFPPDSEINVENVFCNFV